MNKFHLIIFSALISNFAFAEFNVTQKTAGLGVSQTVTLDSITFNLKGNAINVGQYMPPMTLMTSNLKEFLTSNNNEKIRIYNVLASVDTPVCVQQSVDLVNYVKENSNKLKDIEFLALSADTPFAQQRFIKDHSLTDSITFISDSINHEFGEKTGTQIKELGLLTRSIIVVGKDNKILHIQRVPELTTIPDLEKAVDVALKYI